MRFAWDKLPVVGSLLGSWLGSGLSCGVQVELWLGLLLLHFKGTIVSVLLCGLGPLGPNRPWLATVAIGCHENHTV